MKEKEFDALLRVRAIVPPRSGFESRIIAAARAVPQRSRAGMFAWLQFFAAPALPHPRLAFAVTLAIGMIIGFGAQLPSSGESALQIYLNDDGATL